MSIQLREDKGKPELINLAITDLSSMLKQRPGAQAVRWVGWTMFHSIIYSIFFMLHISYIVCPWAMSVFFFFYGIIFLCWCLYLPYSTYRFEAQIGTFEITGMSQTKSVPCLLSSRNIVTDNDTSLLSLMFETNPLDERADQRLLVDSQPLEIIYDAVRTIQIIFTYLSD